MSTNGFAGHRIYDAVENNRPTDVDRDTIVRGNHLVTGYLGAGKQALIATENNQAELIFAPQVAQGERYRMKEIAGDANTFKISRSSPQDRPSTTSLVFQQGGEEIAAFDSDMIEFRAPVKVHGELTVVNEGGTDEQAVFEEHLVIESQANLEMKSQTKIVFHDGYAGTGVENPSGADFAIDLVSSALRFYDMEDDNPMMEVRKDKVVISGDLDVEGRLTTVDGHEATFMEKVFFNHDSSNAVSVQELSSAQLYDTADLFQNFKKAKDAYEAADASLQSSIDDLSNLRKVEDDKLSVAIAAEATSRADADTALQSSIDALSNLRKVEDDTLSVAIAAEATSRADADTALQSSIDALSNLRKVEDDALQASIDQEATDRADADTALQANIDDLSNLRKVEDDTLSVAIAAEATSRAAQDTALQSSIDALSNLRKVEDDTLSVAIAAEATAREAADEGLQAAIDAEAATRIAEDTKIQTELAAEVTARADADTALQANIDDLSNLRKVEDDNLSVAIAAEATSRAAQDTALQSSIDALSNLRKAEDDTLSVAIAAEATSRADADTALQSSIDALSNLRKAEDDALQASIDQEATDRADADTALQANIDDLSNLRKVEDDALSVAIAAEATSRADADTALQSSIDALSNLRKVEDDALSVALAADVQDLADKFEKKQVFTLSGSDSEFYVKDGIVPTTVGQLYIDENGFMRVVMPDVSGMSTLNATFDARIAASQSSGSSLDSEFGYTIPEYNSLSSISEYYGFGEASDSNGYLDDASDPLFMSHYQNFDGKGNTTFEGAYIEGVATGQDWEYYFALPTAVGATKADISVWANANLTGVAGMDFTNVDESSVTGFVKTNNDQYALITDDNGNKLALSYVPSDGA